MSRGRRPAGALAQLLALAAAFAAGTGLAALLGAESLGVALAVGQLFFAAALVWTLLL
jgi:hypothetical protein